jgi:hypothetical protein
MTLALSHTPLLSCLVVVDIAPSKGHPVEDVESYVAAMRRVERAGVKTKKEADEILRGVEAVRFLPFQPDGVLIS